MDGQRWWQHCRSMAESWEVICNFHLFKSPTVFHVTIHTASFLTLLLILLFCTLLWFGTSLEDPSCLEIYLRPHQLQKTVCLLINRWGLCWLVQKRYSSTVWSVYWWQFCLLWTVGTEIYNQVTFDCYRYLKLRNFPFTNLKCFPLCLPTCLLDSIFDCKLVRKRTAWMVYEMYSHNFISLDFLKICGWLFKWLFKWSNHRWHGTK